MVYSAVTMLVAGCVTLGVCILCGNGIYSFFLRVVVCLTLPNIMFSLMNFKRTEFKDTMSFVSRILKRQY